MSSPNGIGIRSNFLLAANATRTSTAVLSSLNLGGTAGVPIAAGKEMKLKYWLKVTVGATGGIRLQVVTPAGVTLFQSTIKLFNTGAPSVTPAAQQASAVFNNALANAGTHWVEIDVYVQNGVNAGTIDLQVAQDTSDVLTATFLKGASLEVITF